MPAVGRIKITRQAGSLAVLANVDVFHRTINTVETSANDVLLAIEALDARVLERWFVYVVVVLVCRVVGYFRTTASRSRLDPHFQKWVYWVDVVHVTEARSTNRIAIADSALVPISWQQRFTSRAMVRHLSLFNDLPAMESPNLFHERVT
jgi:hypothetical protein